MAARPGTSPEPLTGTLALRLAALMAAQFRPHGPILTSRCARSRVP